MAIDPIFDEAIEKAFSKWTLLALAVDQGWGGRDSRAKRNQLQEEVVDFLIAGGKRKRPPTHENQGDVEALANLLVLRLDEMFNVEVDDNSDMEVAGLCLLLYTTCRAGDLSFAQKFLEIAPSVSTDLSKSQGVDRTEYATDEDRLLDQMEGMDEGDGCEDDGKEPAAEEESGVPAPEGTGTQCPAAPEAAPDAPAVADPDAGREAHQRAPPPEPVVDEDGFTSVVKGKRRPR
mmetsp:Transcript_55965/g.126258  ORF Transcript_55965/g.126258 Transcript_55965/m.126258 type:complete len:233 (-) Transcript_55965:74-772(-)